MTCWRTSAEARPSPGRAGEARRGPGDAGGRTGGQWSAVHQLQHAAVILILILQLITATESGKCIANFCKSFDI